MKQVGTPRAQWMLLYFAIGLECLPNICASLFEMALSRLQIEFISSVFNELASSVHTPLGDLVGGTLLFEKARTWQLDTKRISVHHMSETSVTATCSIEPLVVWMAMLHTDDDLLYFSHSNMIEPTAIRSLPHLFQIIKLITTQLIDCFTAISGEVRCENGCFGKTIDKVLFDPSFICAACTIARRGRRIGVQRQCTVCRKIFKKGTGCFTCQSNFCDNCVPANCCQK